MAKQTEASVPSARLTQIDRDGIVRRAVEAAFGKEKAALAKREAALATRCYNAVYALAVRKMVARLPDAWTVKSSRVSFNIGGQHIEFNIEAGLRVPPRCSLRLGNVSDRAIIDAVRAWQGDKDDFRSRSRAAERATEAIVDSCTTTKQLFEAWPQGLPFYKHIAPPQRTLLPATQIAAVNEMLGLKKAA